MSRIILRSAAIAAIALSTIFSASAQEQGKMAIGAQVGYGSASTFGIGGKLQYGISDLFRLDGSVSALLNKDNSIKTTITDISFNAHYLIPLVELRPERSRYLYPLFGIGIYTTTAKADILGYTVKASDTKVGLNLGVGFDQYFNENFSFFTEIKFGLGDDLSRFTWYAGLAYHF